MIGAGAIICLGVNWPGHFSYDSIVQLSEGISGDYSGAHPPVMSWLLGVAAQISPGAVAFIVLQTAMIAAALLAFLSLGRAPAWPAVLVAMVAIVLPQLSIYPAIVWKDVLFAASAIAGFAALAHAAAIWQSRPARRFACLAIAALLLSVATLTRQNGLLTLPFAALAVGWIAARSHGARRLWLGLLTMTGFLSLTGLLSVTIALGLATREEGGFAVSQPGVSLQTYDIVNALLLAPHASLPILHAKAPRLEQILRTDGVADYSPVRADTLVPVFDEIGASGEPTRYIDAQWKDLILHKPLLYLAARARTFVWVFLTPDHDHCVLVYTGIDGPAEEMADTGLHSRRTSWDKAIARFALGFGHTPFYSHAVWAGLGVLILGFLLLRRRPPDIAVAAMLAAAFAFAASFAIISIACDYRYIYPLDLAVIAAALYSAATWNGVVGESARREFRSAA